MHIPTVVKCLHSPLKLDRRDRLGEEKYTGQLFSDYTLSTQHTTEVQRYNCFLYSLLSDGQPRQWFGPCWLAVSYTAKTDAKRGKVTLMERRYHYRHTLPISPELCGGTCPTAVGLELYSDCQCSSPVPCVVPAHLPKALYQSGEDYGPLTEKGAGYATDLLVFGSSFSCSLKTKPTNRHSRTHRRTQGENVKEDGNDTNKNFQEGKYSSVYRVHGLFSVYSYLFSVYTVTQL